VDISPVKAFHKGCNAGLGWGFQTQFSLLSCVASGRHKKNGKVEKNGVSAEGILLAVMLCLAIVLAWAAAVRRDRL
jgi:hypothetical protein